MIGAFIESSVSEKACLNWFHILKDALTIGFREYLDTGSERGIFVQSRAGNDVGIQEAFSNNNHAGLSEGFIQYNINLMLEAQ